MRAIGTQNHTQDQGEQKQSGSGQRNVGGLGRGTGTGQVVPNALCTVSLGSRAGVQGLDAR